MASFADRLLVHLSDPANLIAFLGGMNLPAFFMSDFQTRFNTEFWHIAQVAVGAARDTQFEHAWWQEPRILGREDHQGNGSRKTNIDYKVYGRDTALWTDCLTELDTTWLVDQFPGTVSVSESTPASFEGLATLVSVLRVDTGNHPLDRSGAPLANVTLDNQGQLQTAPPSPVLLTVDPLAGALLEPDGSIHALVTLELFPRLGPGTPLLGAPLGEDGQPLRDLLIDHQGAFTDLAGAPAPLDPLTGLPLDGGGQPVRPARLTIPDGGTMDYRFNFALPVRTNQLTFQFATRLHLLPRAAFNPIEDLRVILSLQHHLAGRHDYLRSLSETTNKQPHAFALVYESNVLNNSEMTQNEVRRLGARTSVLIHFFALP